MINNKKIVENFENFLKKVGTTPYKLAQEIGEGKSNVYNFIKNRDTKYSMILKIVEKYPETIDIFFNYDKKIDPTDILNDPKVEYKTKNFIKDETSKSISAQVCTESDIYINIPSSSLPELAQSDKLGIKKIDLAKTIIDTSSIYVIITKTDDQLIKRLEQDQEDSETLWCHAPNFPKFKIKRSDIKELYKAVCKISKL